MPARRSARSPTPTRCSGSFSADWGSPTSAHGLLLQCGVGYRGRSDPGPERHAEGGEALFHDHGRHVPAVRGHGPGERHRPVPAVRRQEVARRWRAHHPGLHPGRLELSPVRLVRFLRPEQAHPRLHQAGTPRLPIPGAREDEDRRHQHDLSGAGAADPGLIPVQGRRGHAAAYPYVR